MLLEKYIPSDWKKILKENIQSHTFSNLNSFLTKELEQFEVFPPVNEIFSALKLTPYKNVKVVIIGQDPYHDDNQAHGLAFSVRKGVKIPPSLRNIYKELNDDLGCPIPNHGYLQHWAEQGVLMINTVLTVRAHHANSHTNKGWEDFTDGIIQSLNNHPEKIAFILWGKNAEKKTNIIDTEKHYIIQSAHPSPLSARRGFLGSKPFSKVNNFLKANSKKEIDWCIEDDLNDLPLFSSQ